MKFRFHPEARVEFNDAIRWYDEHSKGRGLDFTAEVREAVELICEEPHLWPIFESDCRRALTGRYPYSVIFLVENETVFIIAVAHLSRKPGYWLPRVSV